MPPKPVVTSFIKSDGKTGKESALPVATNTGDLKPVGCQTSAGSSKKLALADHTHAGLSSIRSDSATIRTGDVKLVSGTNITIQDTTVNPCQPTYRINSTAGTIPAYLEVGSGSPVVVPTGVITPVVFDLSFGGAVSNILISGGTSGTDINPKVAGYYKVTANVSFDSAGAGAREIYINLNGGFANQGALTIPGGTGPQFDSLSVSAPVRCNGTTDFFQVQVFQNSGSNKVIDNNAARHSTLSVVWSHPL